MMDNKTFWSEAICRAIAKNLALFERGEFNKIRFVDDLVEADYLLNEARNLNDIGLSQAYHFADSFFDAAIHGFANVDGTPWEEAVSLMHALVHSLQNGLPILDERVNRYKNV